MIFGVLQFGFITIFLSDALVSGYTTGAAVHVFSSQLRHIVGLRSSDVMVEPGLFALPKVSTTDKHLCYVCAQSHATHCKILCIMLHADPVD